MIIRPVLVMLLVTLPVHAMSHGQPRDGTDRNRRSPVRDIDGTDTGRSSGPAPAAGVQSLDGTGNNEADPEMGATDTQLVRIVDSAYADGVAALAGPGRPNPRSVSVAVFEQIGSRPDASGATDFLWQWGQFLDHDIDLTDGTDPPEAAPIAIPAGDTWFDPDGTGTVELPFNRSIYDPATGLDRPRQQLNQITAWIDGSGVYGSDEERAHALRTNDGTGRLATSDGDFLPFNVEGLENAGGDSPDLFLAGDVRANEQLGLTVMHTLFVREHNWHVARIAENRPGLSGEEIYQRARRLVIAEIQAITTREFLPVLLGPDALGPYRGYDPSVDARIANLFSTAAYRFGHSAIGARLLRLDENGEEIAQGHLALRDAFFAPYRLQEGGLEPVLRGLAGQRCQVIDAQVVDDLRNFLFGAPGAGGFDLAALNIQRGRDHGLPGYAAAREVLGLAPVRGFADVSRDPAVQAALASVYEDVEQIDAWVGGLAEDPLPGAMVGELVATVLADQFAALRDGDRFWYENVLDGRERDRVESTRLSDIIRRNTSIGRELADDVFRLASEEGAPPPGRPPRR